MQISQLKEKGQAVDVWVDFAGRIIEIKETKPRTAKNRQMTKVKIAHGTDDISVWFYTDEQPAILNIDVTGNGMLKEYQGVRYVDYATFKPAIFDNPPPQQHQEGAQQATQEQETNNTRPTNDAKNTSIERQAAFKAACHRFQGLNEIDKYEIIDLAIAGHYFIETGKNPKGLPDF